VKLRFPPDRGQAHVVILPKIFLRPGADENPAETVNAGNTGSRNTVNRPGWPEPPQNADIQVLLTA
jgi:hypothetical protein